MSLNTSIFLHDIGSILPDFYVNRLSIFYIVLIDTDTRYIINISQFFNHWSLSMFVAKGRTNTS